MAVFKENKFLAIVKKLTCEKMLTFPCMENKSSCHKLYHQNTGP